jgi:hypothetical protein
MRSSLMATSYRVLQDAKIISTGDERRGIFPETGLVEVYVRHEVDGGTDLRCFDFNQEVPLARYNERTGIWRAALPVTDAPTGGEADA